MTPSSTSTLPSLAAPRPLRARPTRPSSRTSFIAATSRSARPRFDRERSAAILKPAAPAPSRRAQVLLSLLCAVGLVGLLVLGIALGSAPGA